MNINMMVGNLNYYVIMKKFIFLFLSLVIALSSVAQDSTEKSIDDYVLAYRDKMDISYVYVSEAMMKVVDTKDLLSQVNGINGSSLINKLSSIQIVGVQNNPDTKRIWQYVVMGLVSNSFEKLLRLQNKDTTTELYFRKEMKKKNEPLPAELLMVYEAPKSYKVIVFRGNFTLDDVVNAMKR